MFCEVRAEGSITDCINNLLFLSVSANARALHPNYGQSGSSFFLNEQIVLYSNLLLSLCYKFNLFFG